ncbi:MAG: 50S ribosomal protein L11 methyltransferase [Fusobacteriaceae bacterium]|nr:50S ribosomal protein L11 methyltransferase [Fusobacteriaceae bacterium]MBP9509789.1 50S ribosomal protein L11 methyltransferase [Fusobacteriaceae bacterium]
MRVNEIRVVFDSDDIEKTRKEISDLFYSFGATGLKIDEPLEDLNPLDYYKDANDFRNVDNAVSAYFPENFLSKKRNMMIEERLKEIFSQREDVVYTFDIYSYDEEDYQNAWKNYLYPEKISERFVVKPTWREYEPEEDELVIELDPGRAFGTGSHSTTSLCVKLMENEINEENSKELSLLDVGTGSGILMLAAAKLGVKDIVGVDIDELAVEVAQENLILNGVERENFRVLKGDLISVIEDKKFDIVVANILADVLLILLKDIFKVVKPNGKIILSGIVSDKLPEILKEVESLGYNVLEVKEDKEWRALLIQHMKLD